MRPTVYPLAALLIAMAVLLPSHAIAQDKPGKTDQAIADDQAMIPSMAYIESRPQPKFADGHTLMRLTRYGWTLPVPLRIELAKDWGYALEFGGYIGDKAVSQMQDPSTTPGRLAQLAREDPDTYALAVITPRTLPGTKGDVVVTAESDRKAAPDATAEDTASQQGPWARDAEGNLVQGKKVWSPEAPQAYIDAAAKVRADAVRAVREHAPIAIVLNGGEYALGVSGHHAKFWQDDPDIMKAKGDRSWYEYISQRKAEMELAIANAVREAAPDRQLYIYYPTSGGTHRHRWPGWVNWTYGYEWMEPVSDLPSSEAYFNHFNSGWAGHQDMLTLALNAKGWEIKHDQPLAYNWLCAGWPRGEKDDGSPKGMGAIDRYMGFVKMLYTAGMVGGNAGYYSYPKGGFDHDFDPQNPPHWLKQIEVLGRAHALFSHLERFLRHGDLLPGPSNHVYSKQHPAYELPTADPQSKSDKASRVVARKLDGQRAWLVTAWAATGEARDIAIDLPDVGELTLEARPAGSVYVVTDLGPDDREPVVTRMDLQAMLPSQDVPNVNDLLGAE